jgi:hypothetical protein
LIQALEGDLNVALPLPFECQDILIGLPNLLTKIVPDFTLDKWTQLLQLPYLRMQLSALREYMENLTAAMTAHERAEVQLKAIREEYTRKGVDLIGGKCVPIVDNLEHLCHKRLFAHAYYCRGLPYSQQIRPEYSRF